jgi:hypothetical protein
MTRSREYISRFFVFFATVIYAQLQLFCFQRGHLCFHSNHMFGKDLSFLVFKVVDILDPSLETKPALRTTDTNLAC